MSGGTPAGFHSLGHLRLRDLRQVLLGGDDYHVEFARLTEDGIPLFAVYRRRRDG